MVQRYKDLSTYPNYGPKIYHFLTDKHLLFLFLLCLSNIANAQTSEKLYQDALDKGDISILAKNGYILEMRNENEKAAVLYKKAADLGDPWSMFAISNLYDAGKGVQKDFKQSFEYARRAYEHHLDRGLAEGKLGYCYEEGHGCEQNFEMASKFYLEAASKGYNFAYARLAIMYALGKGFDRDKNKALEYIRIAKNNQKKGCQDLYYDQFCLFEGNIVILKNMIRPSIFGMTL